MGFLICWTYRLTDFSTNVSNLTNLTNLANLMNLSIFLLLDFINILSLQSFFDQKREFSSVGSEHLPYKQRVNGSNPLTPTNSSQQSTVNSKQ